MWLLPTTFSVDLDKAGGIPVEHSDISGWGLIPTWTIKANYIPWPRFLRHRVKSYRVRPYC